MTDNSRQRHIQQALNEVRRQDGMRETVKVPLRTNPLVDVIDLPLDVPLLNPASFRIAPQLRAHSSSDVVTRAPHSVEAQEIIASLVRSVHRNAEELKDNLVDEGQTTPGLITREGILVNGNSRCVFLRDLARAGRTKAGTVRVGVLPADLTDRELLELEMILQQQVELKDNYRLVNELMMIQKLFDVGLTDEQIASRRRLRKSRGVTAGDRIRERREILVVMERARALIDPPQPITLFDSDIGKLQNWLELLYDVKAIEASQGAAAADEHIRGWLVAFLSGVAAVHTLRLAKDDWIRKDLVVDLESDPSVADVITLAEESARNQAINTIENGAIPEGLDLLGDDDEDNAEQDTKVTAVLNLTAAARQGRQVSSALTCDELLEQISQSVRKALAAAKRRREAGSKLDRPTSELNRAYSALEQVIEAISEVESDVAFRPLRHAALARALEVRELAERAARTLGEVGGNK